MKKLIILITLTFIILSCSSSENSKKVNECTEQYFALEREISKCNLEETNNTLYIEYSKLNNQCKIYQNVASDKNTLCMNNIEALTCEDVAKFKTIQDINGVEGCFDFPKKTKKQACVENYDSYCRSSFYECGKTALKGICDDTKSIYGTEQSREISFDDSQLENFCNTTVNGSEEIEMGDFFSETCSNYRNNLDCSSVPEFDFRNDDWKTQCSQE